MRRRFMPTRPARRSFTLAELLVAIAIIAVIAGVTAMSVRAVAREARLSSAKNAVTAALDNARALAIRENRIVAAVFRARMDGENRQYVEAVLARWTGESYDVPDIGIVDRFEPIQGIRPRRLPRGIGIAAPQFVAHDDMWQASSYLPGVLFEGEPAGVVIGVMYAPDGTVITRNAQSDSQRFFVDFNSDFLQRQDGVDFTNIENDTPDFPDNQDYCDLGLDLDDDILSQFFCQAMPDDEPYITIAPFLAVYDHDRARQEYDTSLWTDGQLRNEDLTEFITENADRIHFNRYTGVVMR